MKNSDNGQEFIQQVGINGFENTRALGELNLRTWEQLVAQQMETFGLIIDSSVKQLKLSSETQDANKLMTEQMALGRELGEQLTSKGRQLTDISKQTGEAYRNWFEQSIAAVSGKPADDKSA